MEQDVKSFLEYLSREKGYSSNTLAAYTNDLSQLISYAKSIAPEGDSQIYQLNTEVLSGYMLNLKEKKYSQSTVARKIAAARSFIKYMVNTGRLQKDLTPNLASPQITKLAPKPLTVSEVRRFLSETGKTLTPEAKRDKSMLELLYATGLRASELIALNVADINLKTNNVRCASRNSKVRVVPIDQYIAQVVGEYIRESRPKLINNERETALFTNRRGERLTRQGFWQIIQGYADKAGLGKKVTPRSLRHSFAAHRLDGGADLQSIQKLLGHTHISTTRAYKDVKLHS